MICIVQSCSLCKCIQGHDKTHIILALLHGHIVLRGELKSTEERKQIRPCTLHAVGTCRPKSCAYMGRHEMVDDFIDVMLKEVDVMQVIALS